MKIQAMQRLRDARPFQPFRVLVADGNHYNVTRPEFISQNPSGRLTPSDWRTIPSSR